MGNYHSTALKTRVWRLKDEGRGSKINIDDAAIRRVNYRNSTGTNHQVEFCL